MIEWLATLLGRHLRVRGIDRVLRWLYPCRQDSRRFINDVRQRADGLQMALDTRTLIDWELLPW